MKSLIKSILFVAAITVLLQSLAPSAPFKLDPSKEIAPHVIPWRSPIHGSKRLATGFHL